MIGSPHNRLFLNTEKPAVDYQLVINSV